MMQLYNLTPHTLRIEDADTGKFLEFAPSGRVARVDVTRELAERVSTPYGTVAVYRTVYGAVVGLPEPMPGMIYVVSGMVMARVPDRRDVFAPGELVRDDAGRVVGAKGLSR